MGVIGTFLKGAVGGVVGLGIVSWLYSTVIADKEENEESKEGE